MLRLTHTLAIYSAFILVLASNSFASEIQHSGCCVEFYSECENFFGCTEDSIKTLRVSKENFYRVCEILDIRFPDVVYAQARLESGNFKSEHFKNRNNCLGIKRNGKYAYFSHWSECLEAYRDKVQYRCPDTVSTYEEYIDWLVRIGYAQDKSYKSKLLKFLK